MNRYFKLFAVILYVLIIFFLIYLVFIGKLDFEPTLYFIMVFSFILYISFYLVYHELKIKAESELIQDEVEATKESDTIDSNARSIIMNSRQKFNEFVQAAKIHFHGGFILGFFLITGGMVILGFSIFNTFSNSVLEDYNKVKIIAAVVTQFIGATIIVFYRIINRSAIEILQEISKINTIAMAWEQTLQIKDESKKDSALEALAIAIVKAQKNE